MRSEEAKTPPQQKIGGITSEDTMEGKRKGIQMKTFVKLHILFVFSVIDIGCTEVSGFANLELICTPFLSFI